MVSFFIILAKFATHQVIICHLLNSSFLACFRKTEMDPFKCRFFTKVLSVKDAKMVSVKEEGRPSPSWFEYICLSWLPVVPSGLLHPTPSGLLFKQQTACRRLPLLHVALLTKVSGSHSASRQAGSCFWVV